MTFKKFQDYLKEQKAHKWTLPEKTPEPKDGVHKGTYIKPKDYYAPGAQKNPGLMTADDDRGTPFGDRGSPGMTPKNAQPLGEKPAGAPKKVKGKGWKMPKKMKNEAFLDRTANMSDKQFVKKMIENVRHQLPENKIRDLYGREFTPEPAETMKYIASLMSTNESTMGRMIREVKRQGGLEALIKEIFAHPEVYDQIEKIALRENAFSNRLRRKLAEAVTEPRGGDTGGGGGQPAGPNGASAGPLMQQKLGGGGAAGGMGATPPMPPGMEGTENPDGGGMNLDDDNPFGGGEGEEGEDDPFAGGEEGEDDPFAGGEEGEEGDPFADDEEGDEDEDEEGKGKGKHIHFHGGKHTHHHHHGDDDMDDEEDDGEEDDNEEDDDVLEPDASFGKPSGGETGGGIGSGQLTQP